MQTHVYQIIKMAGEQGFVSSSELRKSGFSPSLLCYMKSMGMLRRISRGVYTLPEHISSRETFVEIALMIPHGVLCLLSALQYHELTTQMPYEVWVAIKAGSHYLRNRKMPVRIVQISGEIFSAGIETHDEDGIKIRVYCPARTVVDCFRFRNKIGTDIAVEALRDALKQKKATADEIWEYARQCRMTKVMRPYMEAI